MYESPTVSEVVGSLNSVQREILDFFIGVAMDQAYHHLPMVYALRPIYDTFTPIQKKVTNFLVSEARQEANG